MCNAEHAPPPPHTHTYTLTSSPSFKQRFKQNAIFKMTINALSDPIRKGYDVQRNKQEVKKKILLCKNGDKKSDVHFHFNQCTKTF